jgi:hypothetical protein
MEGTCQADDHSRAFHKRLDTAAIIGVAYDDLDASIECR